MSENHGSCIDIENMTDEEREALKARLEAYSAAKDEEDDDSSAEDSDGCSVWPAVGFGVGCAAIGLIVGLIVAK